jgi:hypothetical protein
MTTPNTFFYYNPEDQATAKRPLVNPKVIA